MKNKRNIILIILVITLAFGAGLLWRWIQGTPYYALYQIGASLKNRDLNTFLTYVDVESILNQQVSGSISTLLSSLTNSNSIGKIAGNLGEIKIQLNPEANKGLSKIAKQQLQNYLENPKNPTLPSSFLLVSLAKFDVKNGYALVTLKKDQDQLRMGLRKQEGIWRVVELNPEDTQRLIKTYLSPLPN
ncbi:MAG: hypothetical protein ABSE95_08365 [Thermodesulfobacteriota bacterium]|jgi:hypothetical protein